MFALAPSSPLLTTVPPDVQGLTPDKPMPHASHLTSDVRRLTPVLMTDDLSPLTSDV